MSPSLKSKSMWAAFKEGFLAGGIGGLVAFLLVFVLLGHGHCSTTKPTHSNGFGAVIEYSNPYIYNMGAIVDGAIIAHGRATNIRFQPYGTFELYTEEILFCGNQAAALQHATGPIVLTYKRAARAMIEGVGCHDLAGVAHIQSR